jgi:D-glycero-alpha-D-manno-heptose-7-phosphate kinase
MLEDNSLLFYLGSGRAANSILNKHSENIGQNLDLLNQLKTQTDLMFDWLTCIDAKCNPGDILNASWEIKKKMTDCTSENIDKLVKLAKDNGAEGVKLCGAGGGGFMLVYCPLNKQEKLRLALANLKELKFRFSTRGSEIIYNDELH